jgi:hypothetical protein
MTDQRPIDPSALRDGDIVRAKRGEHGVVEGVFHSYPISSGWGIGSEAEGDGLFAWNDKGWTITDILADDHDRIVAEAEARGWNAAVEAAIKAVDDVYPVSDQWGHHTLPHIDRRQASAAIAALRKPEVEG